MALPATGPLSFLQLRTEFSASGSVNLYDYRRNGGIVGAGAPNVPTAGMISLSQFHGAANQFLLTISANAVNMNLRNEAMNFGWDGSAPLVVVINSGVYIVSNNTAVPALTIDGTYPDGVKLTNNGWIIGMGGAGGGHSATGFNGLPGGPGLKVLSTVTIANNGSIAGGGGGGGKGSTGDYYDWSGGGGGGAGYGLGGTGLNGGGGAGQGANGTAGTQLAGGTGGAGSGYGGYGGNRFGISGGNGGLLGSAGATGGVWPPAAAQYNSGGAAGAAIIGDSLITWTSFGTLFGPIS
jgi:hypothetical protein